MEWNERKVLRSPRYWVLKASIPPIRPLYILNSPEPSIGTTHISSFSCPLHFSVSFPGQIFFAAYPSQTINNGVEDRCLWIIYSLQSIKIILNNNDKNYNELSEHNSAIYKIKINKYKHFRKYHWRYERRDNFYIDKFK